MVKLRNLWNALGSSLWFVPMLIVLCAAALALGLIEVDKGVNPEWVESWPRLFGGGAEGARGMLTAIAGSTITVLGVIFSITIVALSLASSQYTPRILRNFMKDRANQLVLGVFAGIFTYCLMVLRTIRSGEEGHFVPALAVLFAVLLALLGVGILIYFIHHIATSIQASTIIASVSEETIKAIDKLFPHELGEEGEESENTEMMHLLSTMKWCAVPARKTGYIQSVDLNGLLRFAREQHGMLRMECGIGDFVIEGAPLVRLATDARPGKDASKTLNSILTISRYRTIEQDAAFGIRQLVDIALKALSPGVNDTTTAVVCVDYLSAILVRLAPRRISSPYRFDDDKLRVIVRGVTFESLVSDAFDQIRRNAEGNVAVLSRMLSGIETIASFVRCEVRLTALRRQVESITESAARSINAGHSLAQIAEQAELTLKGLRKRTSDKLPKAD